MNKKSNFQLLLFLGISMSVMILSGAWKWYQLNKEKDHLEKEIKDFDKTTQLNLEKISSDSSEKFVFLNELALKMNWTIDPIKADLALLAKPQFKTQFDLDRWDLALNRVSNHLAELSFAEIKQRTTKNQQWLKKMEALDKAVEDARLAYELNLFKRSQVVQKYQALPWIKHQTLEKFPSSALYQTVLVRKTNLKHTVAN
jgi:hypothetical protein